MAYKLPTFNILCTITQCDDPGIAEIPTPPFRIVGQACQLTYGRRVTQPSNSGGIDTGPWSQSMSLLLPPRVDIRGPQDTVGLDMVEVPEGTGRWYQVVAVDDIGRGFTNEHRSAQIVALIGRWVAPYP